MLDNAVFTFGSALENALEEVEGKTGKEISRKRARVLRKWLPDRPGPKFRDPLADKAN